MAAFVPSPGFGLSSPAEQNGFKFTAELFRGVDETLHEIAMSGPVTPADGGKLLGLARSGSSPRWQWFILGLLVLRGIGYI